MTQTNELTPSAPLVAVSDNWQPIETAPKDGTVVLLRNAKGHIADGHYVPQFEFTNAMWVWPYVMSEPVQWLSLSALAGQVAPQATLTDQDIRDIAAKFDTSMDHTKRWVLRDVVPFARALLSLATPPTSGPSTADILLADRIQNFADWLEPIQKAVVQVAATWDGGCAIEVEAVFDAAAAAISDAIPPTRKAANPCNSSNGSSDTSKADTGETGIPASEIRNAALEDAAAIAFDGPMIPTMGQFLYMNDDCKAMALSVSNRIRALKSATPSTIKAEPTGEQL
jgi:hypothetical protein